MNINNIVKDIKYLIFKLNCAEEDQSWSLVIDVKVDLEMLVDRINKDNNKDNNKNIKLGLKYPNNFS